MASTATSGIAQAGGQQAASGTSFIDMIGKAVDGLNTSMVNADNLSMRMSAGEDVDLHQVMAALEEASIGLQTGLSVRNKAIEAYKEIMAMPL
jgi:flagellar hook-basal body complex protein FliE